MTERAGNPVRGPGDGVWMGALEAVDLEVVRLDRGLALLRHSFELEL